MEAVFIQRCVVDDLIGALSLLFVDSDRVSMVEIVVCFKIKREGFSSIELKRNLLIIELIDDSYHAFFNQEKTIIFKKNHAISSR
jgi:hypothetical protein